MINVLDVKSGETLELVDGRTAVVVENMEDGMWLSVRVAGEADPDETELCHAQDIKRVVRA